LRCQKSGPDEADNNEAAQVLVPFEKLERALERQGSGPFINRPHHSLMDAAYAPFLQRHFFLERIRS
jgi:glutathione S-transferase